MLFCAYIKVPMDRHSSCWVYHGQEDAAYRPGDPRRNWVEGWVEEVTDEELLVRVPDL